MNNDEYIIKYNDDYVHYEGDYLYVSPFKVILKQNTGGTISATPMTGYKGDTVTLSNSANENYEFVGYSISGANLYDTNKFNFDTSNVECEGFWDIDYNPLNLPPYTIRLKYKSLSEPTMSNGTAVQVSKSPNVWDYTYENTNWGFAIGSQTALIEVLGGNTSGITNMGHMFSHCSALSSVALFDTRTVTHMYGMFTACSLLPSVPLFDTSNVSSMSEMFNGCGSLSSVPLFDTSNVTNMSFMFKNCSSLDTVPLFDTSNVTDMSQMFIYCYSLSSVPLFDTRNVTDMKDMFEECHSLSSVPLFDTYNVTSMTEMFYRCSALKVIPLFDTRNVTRMNDTFAACSNVESGALALYKQASTQANPPTSHFYTFYGCGMKTQTGSAELAQIPSDWGGTMP